MQSAIPERILWKGNCGSTQLQKLRLQNQACGSLVAEAKLWNQAYGKMVAEAELHNPTC